MTILGIDFYRLFLNADINLIYNLFINVFAIILILQTFELLNLSRYFIRNDKINGEILDEEKLNFDTNSSLIWDYNIIKSQYSNFNKSVRKIIDFFLIDQNFKKLLYANVLLSAILIVNNIITFFPINFIIIFLLIFIQLLISNRFGGSFNGASDSMIVLILISILFFESDEVANLFDVTIKSNLNQKLSFIYLTFNVCNSYFSAGLVKVKEKNWLKGLALRIFLKESIIESKLKNKILDLLKIDIISKCACIFIILWEISIIFVIFMPNYLIIYLTFGLIFHFSNYLLFGLNRFFLLWIITYPILLYTSIHYLSTLGMCVL